MDYLATHSKHIWSLSLPSKHKFMQQKPFYSICSTVHLLGGRQLFCLVRSNSFVQEHSVCRLTDWTSTAGAVGTAVTSEMTGCTSLPDGLFICLGVSCCRHISFNASSLLHREQLGTQRTCITVCNKTKAFYSRTVSSCTPPTTDLHWWKKVNIPVNWIWITGVLWYSSALVSAV